MELKIKVGKRGIVTGLILLILLALYNILYFVIPFNRSLSNGAFWITYGLTTFLIVFMAVVVFIGIGDKNLKSRVFGLPIIYLGFSTLVAQFVFDATVMSIGHFFEFKTWIAIIVEAVLLAFFFISLIVRTAYKDTIKKIDTQEYRKSYIKELRIELETLLNATSNESVRKDLEDLYETAKYTDPVSYKEVVDIEDEIFDAVEQLKNALQNGDSNKSIDLIKGIVNLLNERKLRLKANK